MGSNLHPVMQQALAPFLHKYDGYRLDIEIGSVPLVVYYDYSAASRGSDVEAPESEQFWILHVLRNGVDVLDLIEELGVYQQIEDAALQQLEANK